MKIDLNRYGHVLLDLDGTICSESDPLPGSIELINRFVRERRSFAILSNSASSPQSVRKRLQKMGIDVPADLIFTAARAAVQYIVQTYGKGARVFDLCTESARTMLEEQVTLVTVDDQPCDVVFQGAPANVHCTPDRQQVALEFLRRGASLVSLCNDRVYPSIRGIEFGSGAMSAMLSYAANVKPIFCGKPERLFFQELCDGLKMNPSECVLIGDNLESDIAGGRSFGMKTILSLTGVTRPQDLNLHTTKPDDVIDSLASFL